MQELTCKIKKILIANKLGLDDQFINFFKTEQQLQQLSKLVYELKKQAATQPLLTEILEPNLTDNKDENLTENAEEINTSQHELDLNETHISAAQHNISESDLNPLENSLSKLAVDNENKSIQKNLVINQNLDISKNQINENIQEKESNNSNEFISEIDSAMNIDKIIVENELQNTQQEQQAEIDKNRAEITDVFNQRKVNNLKFQVDNARAGQLYHSKIQIFSAQNVEDIEYLAESFKFPNDVFYFDEITQSIQGQPNQADEFNFSFQYRMNSEIYTGQCRLNVIADPRSLWKVIEPEARQAFVKAHTDQECIDTPYYQLIAASRRGRSHEHAGSFRDDDFSLMQIAHSDWSVLAVADGAGSAEYSREGSRIAVEIVQKEFQRYLNEHTIDALNEDIKQWQLDQPQHADTQRIANKLNQQFYNVYYEIYRSILMQLDQLAAENNVATKAFSTTLLVAVVYQHADKNLISTFSVGDGAIAAFGQDMVRIMNVADGGEYAGQTKFLDRSIHQELGSRVKIGCFKDLKAVLLMTDGISDPIFETDAGLANQQKWLDLYAELEPVLQQDQPEQALLEWMHFFKTGHHDDRTLAALYKKNSTH
ncbi:protein phosphatase 2C domain-containing protein [Acinetobacter defluvii]|uniref:Protein phosphatase 2C domain-containing protein n=1 Tax=Acinetobacter defluvii TaxID=1871111 RepID=A0A2S2FD12_9GAMM|nr:PP2C family serine/threonine-protein phosphatase [Acinetobacter defluvii]AWL28866.1 protein phosphatase 2C domain-containing protein [Acinetobacter defluvii]